MMPRCKDTNDVIRCPDCCNIEWALSGPGDCKVEDFHVSDIIQ